jgi:hypothetical protein
MGKMIQMPVPPGGAPIFEITEIDALKFRLAVQKDQNIAAANREIENEQALLDQKKETLRLKTMLIRQENTRDVGHLNIEAGDNVFEQNGKFYYKRARPMAAPPTPPDPAPSSEPPVPPPQETPPEGEKKAEGNTESGEAGGQS